MHKFDPNDLSGRISGSWIPSSGIPATEEYDLSYTVIHAPVHAFGPFSPEEPWDMYKIRPAFFLPVGTRFQLPLGLSVEVWEIAWFGEWIRLTVGYVR